MASDVPGQRFGIPSIRGGALRWFYGLFGGGTIYLTITNTLSELARSNAGDWLHIQSIVTEQIVRAAGASLIVSYIIADGGDMVISAILRERNRLKDLEARRKAREEGLMEGREAGREAGLKEGYAEMQAKWEEWNSRREKAEKQGETFDEPPPSLNSRNGTSD